MIKELWSSFPRQLEEKINGLLDEAEPSPAKAFQLYKTCQRESSWTQSFEKFSEHLNTFFTLPRHERRKSAFDAYLERPLSAWAFDDFDLNFRTGIVNESSVQNLVSWAHHLIRVGYKTDSAVISPDVLSQTLHKITHPGFYEKAKDIRFEDFCEAWKKIVFKIFGRKHDTEFNKILGELRWLHAQLQEEKEAERTPAFVPTIYLTQTEIDWTLDVKKAVENGLAVPKFPLSRGPQKQRLIDLERTISLYRIVQTTKLPELLQHRESIRLTILDRCTRLLEECAR